MVLEKTLERPLDSKEIKSVKAKGNQPWIFIERTDAEAANTTSCEQSTYWKRPWCWERLKAGGEGDGRGWDSWMASLTQWTWVWATLGEGEGQGILACCSPWGCKESDTTEWLNDDDERQFMGFPGGSVVKNLPATGRPGMLQSMGSQRVGLSHWTTTTMQEMQVQSLGWIDPLE